MSITCLLPKKYRSPLLARQHVAEEPDLADTRLYGVAWLEYSSSRRAKPLPDDRKIRANDQAGLARRAISQAEPAALSARVAALVFGRTTAAGVAAGAPAHNTSSSADTG